MTTRSVTWSKGLGPAGRMVEAPAGGYTSRSGFRVSGFDPLSNGVPFPKDFARHDFPALEVQIELGRDLDLELDRKAGVLLGPDVALQQNRGQGPLILNGFPRFNYRSASL